LRVRMVYQDVVSPERSGDIIDLRRYESCYMHVVVQASSWDGLTESCLPLSQKRRAALS
jgi:hypothetical protein